MAASVYLSSYSWSSFGEAIIQATEYRLEFSRDSRISGDWNIHDDDASRDTFDSKRRPNDIPRHDINSSAVNGNRCNLDFHCHRGHLFEVYIEKSLANGETFEPYAEKDEEKIILKEKIPSFIISILPILVLIIIIFTGSALKVANIVLIGLAAAIVVAAALFHKYIPSHKTALSLGANGSITPIFFTAAAVAFGVVITMAPGFKVISDFILGIPGNPLISLSVASAALGAITGSSSGGLGIAMEAFAQSYLALGVNAEAMHRISAIASSVFTALPHAGAILSMFALTGLNHKNAYKYSFYSTTLPNFFALIAALILGIIFY